MGPRIDARRDADVIVVGAGPAGSSAAARLAQIGRRVMLLEAASFPRDKVCGDVLLPSLEEALSRIGTSLSALAPEAHEIDGCRFTTPHGVSATGRFRDRHGVFSRWKVLPRRVFDERLARHAARCGADLRERHRVSRHQWDPVGSVNELRVENRDRSVTLRAPLVIAANGAFSQLGPRRGHDHRYSVGLRCYAERSPQTPCFDVSTSRSLPSGCAWIVPGPDGRANVGIGTLNAAVRPTRRTLTRVFEELYGDAIRLERPLRLQGWHLPTPRLGRPTVADGLLRVGDAAGFVNPFTGHGIHNAVVSGILAADASHRALLTGELDADGPALRAYERSWRRVLGPEFGLGSLLSRMHGGGRLLEGIMARAARDGRWADQIMGLVGHSIPRQDMLRPRFLWNLMLSTRQSSTEALAGGVDR